MECPTSFYKPIYYGRRRLLSSETAKKNLYYELENREIEVSFFGNCKTIIKSILSFFQDGVELLARGAESMERGANRLLLETKAAHLEKEIERLVMDDVGSLFFKIEWQKLSQLYDQIWVEATQFERDNIAAKRKKYALLLSDVSISDLEREIEKQQLILTEKKFLLPIEQIGAMKSLQSLQHKLALELEFRGDVIRSEPVRREFQKIDLAIAELELERDQVEIEEYSDGTTKRRLEKRDGQLNGHVKGWYPTGELEYQISYRDGKFENKAEYWRPDGTRVCEISRLDDGGEFSVWLSGGEKIAEGKVEKNNGSMLIWLWDGYYLGTVKLKDGRPSKASFIFLLFFKPGLWLRIIQKSKRDVLLNELPELSNAFDSWAVLSHQLIANNQEI